MSSTRARFASCLALVLVAGSASAAPDDARARAKETYARGLRAHDAGDLRGAATLFAEADALAPSPVALRAAIDAAVDADDPALGAELLERSARGPIPPPLQESIVVARGKLGGRAGKILLDCSGCTGSVDDREIVGARWVAVGRHHVTVRAGAETKDVDVEVAADATVTVTAPVPAPIVTPPPVIAAPPPPPPVATHGGSPKLVYAGGIVALSLAGLAVAGGVLASQERDDFRDHRCGVAPYSGCEDIQSDGRRYVTITNILVGASVVTAIATTIVAFAFTDWKRSRPTSRAPAYLLTF